MQIVERRTALDGERPIAYYIAWCVAGYLFDLASGYRAVVVIAG